MLMRWSRRRRSMWLRAGATAFISTDGMVRAGIVAASLGGGVLDGAAFMAGGGGVMARGIGGSAAGDSQIATATSPHGKGVPDSASEPGTSPREGAAATALIAGIGT